MFFCSCNFAIRGDSDAVCARIDLYLSFFKRYFIRIFIRLSNILCKIFCLVCIYIALRAFLFRAQAKTCEFFYVRQAPFRRLSPKIILHLTRIFYLVESLLRGGWSLRKPNAIKSAAKIIFFRAFMPSEYFCILENLPDNKPQYTTLYPSHHFIWLPHAPTIQKVLQKKPFAVLPHHSILKFIFPIRQVHY